MLQEMKLVLMFLPQRGLTLRMRLMTNLKSLHLQDLMRLEMKPDLMFLPRRGLTL